MGLMVAVVLAVVVCLVVRVRRRDGGKITDTSRGNNNIHNPTYTGEHSWCSNLYLLSDVSMMPNVLYDYDSESI